MTDIDLGTSMSTYIKEKIKENLRLGEAIYKRINTDFGALIKISEDVKKLKTDKGEKGFPEAKELLAKIQQIHYNKFLLEQSASQYQVVAYEFYIMAKTFGVEIEEPKNPETKSYFDQIIANSPHIFTLHEGQPTMVSNEMTETVMAAMKEKVQTDENLMEMYKGV